jgi:hypothetical protein
MLKKTLYLVAMALGLAACEGLPTKPDHPVPSPAVIRADTSAVPVPAHKKIDL